MVACCPKHKPTTHAKTSVKPFIFVLLRRKLALQYHHLVRPVKKRQCNQRQCHRAAKRGSGAYWDSQIGRSPVGDVVFRRAPRGFHVHPQLEPIARRIRQVLSPPQIPLGRLHAGVAERELYLLTGSVGLPRELCEPPAHVVGRERFYFGSFAPDFTQWRSSAST